MARVIEFREQTLLILPFVRVGVERHHASMAPRPIALEPLDTGLLKRKGLRMHVVRFCVNETIENDLLVNLIIRECSWTNGFVSAALLKQLRREALLDNPEQVIAHVKTDYDLRLDCGLVVSASWVVE